MSNVLLGIIGVVLFIGLALAGALYLGQRFQDAANDSRASADVQAITQVTHAIGLYRVAEGTAYDPSGYPANLVPAYLRSEPALPNGNAVTFRTVEVDGEYVLLATSKLTANARETCGAISRQSLGDPTPPTVPTGPAGCYTNGAAYFVFSRV